MTEDIRCLKQDSLKQDSNAHTHKQSSCNRQKMKGFSLCEPYRVSASFILHPSCSKNITEPSIKDFPLPAPHIQSLAEDL